ncbi:MAG: hypothetical protein K0S32_2564, partial [Bacteroidetes bacterium]|nr:hypothetical protein [Bacteroidota bacterium]
IDQHQTSSQQQNLHNINAYPITLNDYNNSKFDLLFVCSDQEGQLQLSVIYNTDIFSSNTISRMLTHLEELTRDAINHSELRLDKLNYIREKEKTFLLNSLDNRDAVYNKSATIISEFESQVKLTPQSIAVRCNEVSLSYEQLNKISNQLSAYLHAFYKLKKEDRIAIRLDRNEWMIIAIFGVLKSGCVYVPLDKTYPQDRIDYMLSDSGSKIVIDENELEKFLSEQDKFSGLNTVVASHPTDLAYIIYTSGTTGKPKGAMIEHRNVVRLLKTEPSLFDFSESDVWTMFHSYCFDFSVWEMYGALLFGGKLVIVPESTTKDPAAYVQLLLKEKVTVLNQTPSAFYNIAKQSKVDATHKLRLRYVIFGGEALLPAKLKEWHKTYPGTKLINMYGITETTVHVTYKEIGNKEINSGLSNIGKPIPTLSCYVLDHNQQPLPIGVPGELYVGGDGLARGYINKEDLTRERFLIHPYNKQERLYRSGDKVRLLENGEMEYLGRVDDQVKIRGYRIELGEIENTLVANPLIQDAVAIVKSDAVGEKNIVAYVTGKEKLNVNDLRNWLSLHLPAYMIPSYYVQMERLPLTSNGKIDKRSLPDPAFSGMSTGKKYIAPSNDIENKLAVIWSEILEIPGERISTNDNFFELGGHSLKAVRLMMAIQRELGVKTELRDIFKYPEISSLSAQISNHSTGGTQSIPVLDAQEHYALSPSQKRLWILNQLEKNSTAYNIPLIFNYEQTINTKTLTKAFNALIQRHEILRTVFATINGEPRQKILGADEIHFSIEQKDFTNSTEKQRDVQAVFGDYAAAIFDLASGPLLKAALIKLENDKYVFVLVMPHIITDEISNRILMTEVIDLYRSYEENRQISLPSLPVTYKDYAAWHNKQVNGDNAHQMKKFWNGYLNPPLTRLNMPLDKPRPAVKSFKGEREVFLIGSELVSKIKEAAAGTGSTMFMNVISMVNIMLHKHTGQTDVVIGSPVSGRDHDDVSGIIGFFVNTLVLRTKMETQHSYFDVLGNVKQNVTDCLNYQLYPFDKIIEDLNIKNEQGSNLLFDVFVSYHKSEHDYLIDENEFSRGETWKDFVVSQFDLTLDFNDIGQQLILTIDYNTDIFERSSVILFKERFFRLIENIVNNPLKKLSDLDYKTKTETDMEKMEIEDDFN